MKKQNGITLIALVITIIVLLILAGVTISLVIGDNGILTQATLAVKENKKDRRFANEKTKWYNLNSISNNNNSAIDTCRCNNFISNRR